MLSIARMSTDNTSSAAKTFAPYHPHHHHHHHHHHFDERSGSKEDGSEGMHTPPSAMSQPRAVRSPIRFDVDFTPDLNFTHHQHPIHVHQPNYALAPSTPFAQSSFSYPPTFRNSYEFPLVPDLTKISTSMSSQYIPSDHLQTYLSPVSIPDTRLSSEQPPSAHVNGSSQSPVVSSPTSVENNPSGSSLQYKQSTSDQPPTTQGKARTRVYVACLQCRSRKIRCDGAKPTCHNCGRRSSECKYDAVPKRRGPDKKPGARQRTVKKKDGDSPTDDKVALKKKRRKSDEGLEKGVGDVHKVVGNVSPKDYGSSVAGSPTNVRAGPMDLGLAPSRPLYITPPIPPLAEMDQRQDRISRFQYNSHYFME